MTNESQKQNLCAESTSDSTSMYRSAIENILRFDIQTQYNKITYELDMLIDFDEIGKFIKLETPNHLHFLGQADYQKSTLSIPTNAHYINEINKTILHELAHFIAMRFANAKDHTLEFAIINYCLQFSFVKRRADFFCSYDIKDDIAKPFIKLNTCEFDNLIANITYNSLEELGKKAKKLATKIREKCVPYGLAE